MTAPFKAKATSYETLRRNADDLRRIVEALVPDQNKDGSAKMLYDIVRNWNLRQKRKDRKFKEEWLFRNHQQWLVEGVATSLSKSERSLKTLVSGGYLIKKEANLDGKKTLHLQPSPYTEAMLCAVSQAIESLMGQVPVRRFLVPLLDWTKRQDPAPTTLHYYFRKKASGEAVNIIDVLDMLNARIKEMTGKTLTKPEKDFTAMAKAKGWDDEPLEVLSTKLTDYEGDQSVKTVDSKGDQPVKPDGSLYSNKGTSNKGTEGKGTGHSPSKPLDQGSYQIVMSGDVVEGTVSAKSLGLFSHKGGVDPIPPITFDTAILFSGKSQKTWNAKTVILCEMSKNPQKHSFELKFKVDDMFLVEDIGLEFLINKDYTFGELSKELLKHLLAAEKIHPQFGFKYHPYEDVDDVLISYKNHIISKTMPIYDLIKEF